jgi:hypothetical protein
MIKISDAVRTIVEGDPALRTGLAQRLMNLSQVARHIQASVEARTNKPVKLAAITMALSRLQAGLPHLDAGPRLDLANRITVQRGLTVLTFANTLRFHEGLIELQQRIRPTRAFLTITEGIREITIIIEDRTRPIVDETVAERPHRAMSGVASLSVSLTDEDLATPGILYRLLQPLALQGVNVVEVASTATEFHVYLAERDVMLALDSLYGAFRRP